MGHLQLTVWVLVLLMSGAKCQNDIRKPPNIIEPNSPKTLYFSANTYVEVKCKAEGIPTPTYRWTRNGNSIAVDNLVMYDSISGSLHITDFTKREEGTYMCIASNVFDDEGGRVTATSFAPPVKLLQSRVERFRAARGTHHQTHAYEYVVLSCANKGEVVDSLIVINWYHSEHLKDVSLDGGRLFIDQNGDLHFSYVLPKDASIGFAYVCGMSVASDNVIVLGNGNYLTVTPVQTPIAIKPHLQYSNSGVKGLKFSKTRLECVFSGYDPAPPHSPIIQWFDDSGREISVSTEKYTFSDYRRALTVNNLQEEDEKPYYCQARNSAGNSEKMPVLLDVTSAPVFNINGAPKDQTVVENVDATFHCDARSASNEPPPNSPIWYINGVKTGQHTDRTKFQLSNGNKTLTVSKVKKATDIMCVQCEITNLVDTTWADACLTVILPIKIEKRPPKEQEIAHGDIVDLTVTASTDPSMVTSLKYRWEYENETYTGSDAPLYVTYDPITMLAYINTSLLTEDQYDTVGGTYRRTIYHSYETVNVDTVVLLKHKPAPPSTWRCDVVSARGTADPVIPVSENGGSAAQFVGTIVVGIFAVVLIIFIIVLIIYLLKSKGVQCKTKKHQNAYTSMHAVYAPGSCHVLQEVPEAQAPEDPN